MSKWPQEMKASDLIEELEKIVKLHGDLPVLLTDDSSAREVIAYDADGNTRKKRVVIVIHGH